MDDRTPGERAGRTRAVHRRSVLAAGVATVAALAGCADEGPADEGDSNAADPADDEAQGADDETQNADEPSDGGDDEDKTGEEGDPGNEDESTDEDSALEHPSARNMDHSPVLGPDLEEGATILMYDDPSCPACAYFEAEIFPDLESYVDAGDLSVVWRGVPVIEEWSDASLQALWATYERDVDAFWALRDHLFAIQDSIASGEEAIDEAVSYLEAETAVDAADVRSEAESGEYSTRINRDTDAAARAGLDATPYFFLFRDGEFRTEIRGAEDARVFTNALEL
ncbi:DsbA family protein [Natrononativus amylolyticus]|uniref:DsbA family protein n=1 Tax=Natrononativus amylolyticus TaxID=2963434 RepID=UPI0020CFD8CB|nr:thioredoxin domain-containing protein [Natrononativus amylolyticus]